MLQTRRDLAGEQLANDEAEGCIAVAEGDLADRIAFMAPMTLSPSPGIGLPPTPMDSTSSLGLPRRPPRSQQCWCWPEVSVRQAR
jgi:hypothetical protein